jgi:hypothetical protein
LIADLLQGFALLHLNTDIRIQKVQTQFFGKENTNSALSCSWHANKYDYLLVDMISPQQIQTTTLAKLDIDNNVGIMPEIA